MKGSALTLIDAYDIILGPDNMNKRSSYQNLWNHWRLLTLLSPERVKFLTASMFFTKDDALTGFVGGCTLTNGVNPSLQSFNNVVTPALPSTQNIPTYNAGLAERARVTNKRLQPYIGNQNMNNSYMIYQYSYAAGNTSAGSYTYNWTAFIPLRFISDFFNKLNFPVSGALFVINLFLNLDITRNTVPYMFTDQAYQQDLENGGGGAGLDCLAFNQAVNNTSGIPSPGLVVGTNGIFSSGNACQLW